MDIYYMFKKYNIIINIIISININITIINNN